MDAALLILSAVAIVAGSGAGYLAMRQSGTEVSPWMWTLFGLYAGAAAVVFGVSIWLAVLQFRKGGYVSSMIASALPMFFLLGVQIIIAKF